MNDSTSAPDTIRHRPIRWWPGVWIVLLALAAVTWARWQNGWPFQKRNLLTFEILIVTTIALLVWWTFFSRAPGRLRLTVTFSTLAMLLLLPATLRIRGVSGDLVPVIEFRWAGSRISSLAPTNTVPTVQRINDSTNGFPQFLGPERTGVLAGPKLGSNWSAHPPAVVWRQKIGAGWSGFSVVGERAVTQEQRGEAECVTCYDLATGGLLWSHTDPARYFTTIAGEGPRATPTVVSNRVFTLGATGILNCLDLATGRRLWTRNVVSDSGGNVPDWGATSSPLCLDGLVIVHGGEKSQHSLHGYRAEDGKLAWSAGTMNPSYASPVLATLAGVRQVLAFNDGSVSGHDPATGTTLWERPWGNGNVVCSSPVVIGEDRVLFSSGYGVGAELLEISRAANGRQSAKLVWKSIRMKAKFAHLYARDGCLYGLDDGIFAGLDLLDGSQKWKEGRYGHGQGLLVGELYLLLAESGELVLLRPTPQAPNELARFRVLNAKTWNPIALIGDLLLVRNDQEAACLRLTMAK